MTSPDRARTLAELDALTAGLPEAAAALAARVHMLADARIRANLATAVRNGRAYLVCLWCWQDAGTCHLTGGRPTCDAIDDHTAATAQTLTAPTIHIGHPS